MSVSLGVLLVACGSTIIVGLACKLLAEPFVPENHFAHAFFPSTFWVLVIPTFCGTVFFLALGLYIIKQMNSPKKFK